MRIAPLLVLTLLAGPALAEPAICTFRRGADLLNEACLATLADLVKTFEAAPGARLEVTGHAQDQQGPRLDILLSRRRAAAVAEELQRLGIPATRIAVSAAPPEPPADMTRRITREARRVEVELRR